jgi:hypothetical protein
MALSRLTMVLSNNSTIIAAFLSLMTAALVRSPVETPSSLARRTRNGQSRDSKGSPPVKFICLTPFVAASSITPRYSDRVSGAAACCLVRCSTL